MKYKIAICKTYSCGSPVLVMGTCRCDEDDEFWTMSQKYTLEEYLNIQYKYVPPTENDFCSSLYKSQEECDSASENMQKYAKENVKYQGKTIYFESINKNVPIYYDGEHDFSFKVATQIELTKEELKLLQEEMLKDNWERFDDESWAK